MDDFKITSIVFALLGLLFFILSLRKAQLRDKRFAKGVKLKFNFTSLIFVTLSFVFFYISYRLTLI